MELVITVLASPLWNIGAAIAAVVAAWIAFRQLSLARKDIRCDLIANVHLVNVRTEVKNELQVLFQGVPVDDLSGVIVKVYNAGRTPILPSEYERPIEVRFGQDATILHAFVTLAAPQGVQASLEIQSDRLVLRPGLLNRGDSIQIQVIVSHFTGTIYPDARVVGVKQVGVTSRIRRLGRVRYVLGYGLYLVNWFLLVLLLESFGVLKAGGNMLGNAFLSAIGLGVTSAIWWWGMLAEDAGHGKDIRHDMAANIALIVASVLLVYLLFYIVVPHL